jgi:ComF family protein
MGYPIFQHACAGLEFHQGGSVQRLIHVMKYEQRPDLARHLGRLLGEELKPATWWRGYDALVPVPLHPRRQRRRGYNQSEWLAQGLRAEMNLPVRLDLARRLRNTRSQTGLSRDEREANVADAFVAEPAAAGLRLLLVDDVVTTGATLLSLASSFVRVGVGGLGILVLADAFSE